MTMEYDLCIPQLTQVSESAFTSPNQGAQGFDALVVLFTSFNRLNDLAARFPFLRTALAAQQVNPNVANEPFFLFCDQAPGSRLILSPTGSTNDDTDDVRKFAAAARAATKLVKKSAASSAVFFFADPPTNLPHFSKWLEVSLLGVLAESYVSLTVRRHQKRIGQKMGDPLHQVGFFVPDDVAIPSGIASLVKNVVAIEHGRRTHLDMGYGDPEEMTPVRCAEYIKYSFTNVPGITVKVQQDLQVIQHEYPLMYAVARASLAVPRHHPCVVTIEYNPPDPSQVKEHIYLVGKGVTYDTGGIDIKANGAMRGMSRDKLGATSVAGFMMTVARLAPKTNRFTAELAFVRNSVGADSYLSDEVIYSRAGKRVLIGNTDAEGRLIMTDLLCQCREKILAYRQQHSNIASSIRQHVFTVATLTGHVIRAYGFYGAFISNGPAIHAGVPNRLQKAGDQWGDPYEHSHLRSDDFAIVQPGSDREDVCQTNHLASSATPRGHMFPAAYLIIASGLKSHGNAAPPNEQISYTHIDIAGNSEEASNKGMSLCNLTGNPVPSLAAAFLDL
ncbi:hypothetical protein IWQ61_003117 [Dispira simplex]|nr:hypothetical protein IWQ61_003117 [Dispira simplex]